MNILSKLAAFVGGISPKNKAGLNWATLAGLVVWGLNLVTPEMLTWAGPYAPLLFAAVPIVSGQIAAWVKTDPLREEGKASLAAKAAADAPQPPADQTEHPVA